MVFGFITYQRWMFLDLNENQLSLLPDCCAHKILEYSFAWPYIITSGKNDVVQNASMGNILSRTYFSLSAITWHEYSYTTFPANVILCSLHKCIIAGDNIQVITYIIIIVTEHYILHWLTNVSSLLQMGKPEADAVVVARSWFPLNQTAVWR